MMLGRKRAVEMEGTDRRGESDSRKLIAAAGMLILAALFGLVVDWMWLALLPAAALLAAGAARIGSYAGRKGDRPLQFACAAVSVTTAVLIVLSLTGIVVQLSTRIEPGWLSATVTAGGWLFLASVIVFGLVGSVTRSLPRMAGLSMALSLPLGIWIDAALSRLPGPFSGGVGTNVGLGLFGLSLLFVSRGRRLQASDAIPDKAPGSTRSGARPARSSG